MTSRAESGPESQPPSDGVSAPAETPERGVGNVLQLNRHLFSDSFKEEYELFKSFETGGDVGGRSVIEQWEEFRRKLMMTFFQALVGKPPNVPTESFVFDRLVFVPLDDDWPEIFVADAKFSCTGCKQHTSINYFVPTKTICGCGRPSLDLTFAEADKPRLVKELGTVHIVTSGDERREPSLLPRASAVSASSLGLTIDEETYSQLEFIFARTKVSPLDRQRGWHRLMTYRAVAQLLGHSIGESPLEKTDKVLEKTPPSFFATGRKPDKPHVRGFGVQFADLWEGRDAQSLIHKETPPPGGYGLLYDLFAALAPGSESDQSYLQGDYPMRLFAYYLDISPGEEERERLRGILYVARLYDEYDLARPNEGGGRVDVERASEAILHRLEDDFEDLGIYLVNYFEKAKLFVRGQRSTERLAGLLTEASRVARWWYTEGLKSLDVLFNECNDQGRQPTIFELIKLLVQQILGPKVPGTTKIENFPFDRVLFLPFDQPRLSYYEARFKFQDSWVTIEERDLNNLWGKIDLSEKLIPDNVDLDYAELGLWLARYASLFRDEQAVDKVVGDIWNRISGLGEVESYHTLFMYRLLLAKSELAQLLVSRSSNRQAAEKTLDALNSRMPSNRLGISAEMDTDATFLWDEEYHPPRPYPLLANILDAVRRSNNSTDESLVRTKLGLGQPVSNILTSGGQKGKVISLHFDLDRIKEKPDTEIDGAKEGLLLFICDREIPKTRQEQEIERYDLEAFCAVFLRKYCEYLYNRRALAKEKTGGMQDFTIIALHRIKNWIQPAMDLLSDLEKVDDGQLAVLPGMSRQQVAGVLEPLNKVQDLFKMVAKLKTDRMEELALFPMPLNELVRMFFNAIVRHVEHIGGLHSGRIPEVVAFDRKKLQTGYRALENALKEIHGRAAAEELKQTFGISFEEGRNYVPELDYIVEHNVLTRGGHDSALISPFITEVIQVLVENAVQAMEQVVIETARNNVLASQEHAGQASPTSGKRAETSRSKQDISLKLDIYSDSPGREPREDLRINLRVTNTSPEIDKEVLEGLNRTTPRPLTHVVRSRTGRSKRGSSGFGFYLVRTLLRDFIGRGSDARLDYNTETSEGSVTLGLPYGAGTARSTVTVAALHRSLTDILLDKRYGFRDAILIRNLRPEPDVRMVDVDQVDAENSAAEIRDLVFSMFPERELPRFFKRTLEWMLLTYSAQSFERKLWSTEREQSNGQKQELAEDVELFEAQLADDRIESRKKDRIRTDLARSREELHLLEHPDEYRKEFTQIKEREFVIREDQEFNVRQFVSEYLNKFLAQVDSNVLTYKMPPFQDRARRLAHRFSLVDLDLTYEVKHRTLTMSLTDELPVLIRGSSRVYKIDYPSSRPADFEAFAKAYGDGFLADELYWGWMRRLKDELGGSLVFEGGVRRPGSGNRVTLTLAKG